MGAAGVRRLINTGRGGKGPTKPPPIFPTHRKLSAIIARKGEAMKWHTPPSKQGQIVEVSYQASEDGEHIVKRVHDKSTGQKVFQVAEWIEGDFEPWNEKLPKLGPWRLQK